MGVACAARCADDDALPDVAAEAGCDVDSARAIERMGGDGYLTTAGQSEKQLAASGLAYTVLRLGALTDAAGMIPVSAPKAVRMCTCREASWQLRAESDLQIWCWT